MEGERQGRERKLRQDNHYDYLLSGAEATDVTTDTTFSNNNRVRLQLRTQLQNLMTQLKEEEKKAEELHEQSELLWERLQATMRGGEEQSLIRRGEEVIGNVQITGIAFDSSKNLNNQYKHNRGSVKDNKIIAAAAEAAAAGVAKLPEDLPKKRKRHKKLSPNGGNLIMSNSTMNDYINVSFDKKQKRGSDNNYDSGSDDSFFNQKMAAV